MATNIKLRRELKAIRQQVAKLEEQQALREDKVIELFERIAPFFPAMSEAAKQKLEKILDEENTI